MKNICIECGRKRRLFSHNYAGLNVRDAIKSSLSFAISQRYKDLTLPGKPGEDFLCSTCANKRKAECVIHGVIKDKFSRGRPPICIHCQEERDKEIKYRSNLLKKRLDLPGNEDARFYYYRGIRRLNIDWPGGHSDLVKAAKLLEEKGDVVALQIVMERIKAASFQDRTSSMNG